MPPEQAEGKLEMIDHRSDVYSLGAILYEILTLERPIEGDTVHKVLLNVSEGKVTPPEQRTPEQHVPKELSAVVMKAMSKNRRKRYQSVQDLGQDIKLFLEGRSVSAKEDSLAEAVTKLVKRNKGVSAAIAVATIVILVLGVGSYAKVKTERDEAVKQRQAALEARQRERETALAASEEMAIQAVQLVERGILGEAEVRAEAAEKLAPFAPWGLYARGRIAMERKEFQKAKELLSQATSKDRKNERVKSALETVRLSLGELDEALAFLSQGTEGKGWREWLKVADALYEAGRYREAAETYGATVEKLDTAAKEVDPSLKDWSSLVERADALLDAGRHPEAKAAYEKAIEWMKADKALPPGKVQETTTKLGQATASFRELREATDYRAGSARAWVACEGFHESIKNLPARQQLSRIDQKLQEIHGIQIRLVNGTIEEGVLMGVLFHGSVKFLQPLRGMPLKRLSARNRQALRDLEPLGGMALEELWLGSTLVSDLAPLKGMPLERLDLYRTRVSDLSPLRGMKLRALMLGDCGPIADDDLSLLRGMPLENLDIVGTSVADLSVLKGLCLKHLRVGAGIIGRTRVDDLSPLEGMPLEGLVVFSTRVSDLSPLKGMALTRLRACRSQVSDLSPLKGMPLQELDVHVNPVSDLSPLKGMRLTKLHIYATGVGGLSPLKGMPLEELLCERTQVQDLAPLRGMPLKSISINGTGVGDLTPLEGMSLGKLLFTPSRIKKGMELIRSMKSLNEIGIAWNMFWPADEFWQKYDAGEFR